MTEEYWSFESDGTFSSKKDELRVNSKSIDMPRYAADGKDVQVYLSEYTINSGIQVAHDIGMLRTPFIKVQRENIR